jgi:cbb3-type cytochrome oxidase subunit 3
MKTRFIFQAAVAAAVWAQVGAAHACAVCINGAGGEKLLDAFNWSVLFLMAMPYTILFGVIGFFVYAYRRAAKKQRAEESAVMSPAHDLS